MSDAVALTAIFGGIAAFLVGCAVLALHVRRRGPQGSAARAALASWEEAYRITSREAYVEIQEQSRRKLPMVSPDRHWQPLALAGDARQSAAGRPRTRRGRWGIRLRRTRRTR